MSDQPRRPPLASARRAHILAVLASDGAVRISQLLDDLSVTPVTLRRDLGQMEDEGLLERVHGGAVAIGGSANTPAATAIDSVKASGHEKSLKAIAVLVPSLHYYWPSVVRGLEREARRWGYQLVLRGASYELQDERPVLERLIRSEGVKGLIVAPNTHSPHAQDVVQWIAHCGIPSVLIERDAVVFPERVPLESVTSDHALGARLAARHLASLGHKRIGLVMQGDTPTSRKIAAGWQQACRELGLGPDQHIEQLVNSPTGSDFAASVNASLDRIVATGTTALLAHPDNAAMALVDLALGRGLVVPDDLSIMAYDDEMAELSTPAISAVSPPREGVGAAAVNLLLHRMADPDRPVHRVSLSPSLVLRESTAPPRSGA